jgi:predicted TPR repeat methyltransferase
MTDTGTGNHLDNVYASKSADEVAKGYDRWAETYDQDMGASGYRHPTICLALISRYIKTDHAAILDAGAGTGLIGEWLRIIGYRELVALDASDGMLEVARRKGVYDELHQGFMGQTLPFDDDRFTGAVSAGVFTLGHVGPEGLNDLLRVVRRGGFIVLTVKDRLLAETDFRQHVDKLCGDGYCRLVEETPSYISIPGEASQSTSRAFVLEVLH